MIVSVQFSLGDTICILLLLCMYVLLREELSLHARASEIFFTKIATGLRKQYQESLNQARANNCRDPQQVHNVAPVAAPAPDVDADAAPDAYVDADAVAVAVAVAAPAPAPAPDVDADALNVLEDLLTKIRTAYDTEKNKFIQARGSGAGMQTKDKQFQISYDNFHYVYARMRQTKDFNVMFANLFRMYLTEKPSK